MTKAEKLAAATAKAAEAAAGETTNLTPEEQEALNEDGVEIEVSLNEYNPAKTSPVYAEGVIKHKVLKNGYAHTFIFKGRDHKGEEAIAFFRYNKLMEEHSILHDELMEDGPKEIVINYNISHTIEGVTNYKKGDDIIFDKTTGNFNSNMFEEVSTSMLKKAENAFTNNDAAEFNRNLMKAKSATLKRAMVILSDVNSYSSEEVASAEKLITSL